MNETLRTLKFNLIVMILVWILRIMLLIMPGGSNFFLYTPEFMGAFDSLLIAITIISIVLVLLYPVIAKINKRKEKFELEYGVES